MILIDFKKHQSDLEKRVEYLLFGAKGNRDETAVEVLEGNPQLFLEFAKQNKYKTNAFAYLVSFAESKEELEKKLKQQGKTIKELHDEILSFITAGYSKDELNILSVAHSDTEHYHFHITIDSRNQLTDTQLYVDRHSADYWRLIEKYISYKYQISLNTKTHLRSEGRAGIKKIKEILKRKGKYKNAKRDEAKEEITNILAIYIAEGLINSRDELIKALELENIEVVRKGKNYITISHEGEKIRLKGGIYSDEHFRRIKAEITGEKERNRADIQRELERVREQLYERMQKITAKIEKRFRTARERAKKRFEKTIKDISLNTITAWSDFRFDNRSRNWNMDSSLQLQGEQTAVRGASNKDTGTRELAEQSKLSAVRETAIHLLRPKDRQMEKRRKNYLSYSPIAQRLREAIMSFEEKRKAELEAIKSIPPELIIADLGIPCIERPSYYECRAVWRGDKNPSLSIFPDGDKWKWKDHATGQSGSWIDLYMVARNMSYVEAVKYLRENFLGAEFDLSTSEPTQSKKYEVLSIEEKPITRKVIKDFLKDHRKIEHIPNWLREIEYEIFDTQTGEVFNYFGFGVKDEAGNYHIRYATDKSKVKERVIGDEGREEGSTYTHIIKASDTVVVVEGFIDAIRAEQLFPGHDLVILNGVENIKKALPALARYKNIILATDQDNAGQKVRNTVKRQLPLSNIYELKFNAKDLDEAVKRNLKIEIQKYEKPKIEQEREKKNRYGPRL